MTMIVREDISDTEVVNVSDEVTKLGITIVPVKYYHYRNYRYTNLKDAIDQARRDQTSG